MNDTRSLQTVHGTAVAIGGAGILLTGPSGSGKSDLALRLIDRGATLVSDDIVMIDTGGHVPVMHIAPNIGGMIEARGLGILQLPCVDAVPLRLIVELGEVPERLPNGFHTRRLGRAEIATVVLRAFEASTAIKIVYALDKAIADTARQHIGSRSA